MTHCTRSLTWQDQCSQNIRREWKLCKLSPNKTEFTDDAAGWNIPVINLSITTPWTKLGIISINKLHIISASNPPNKNSIFKYNSENRLLVYLWRTSQNRRSFYTATFMQRPVFNSAKWSCWFSVVGDGWERLSALWLTKE